MTERVELDRYADFLTTGETETLVYCASPRVRDAVSRLGSDASVVDGGQPVQMRRISEDLSAHGGPPADGRGRRHGAHPVPDRQPRRRAGPDCTTFVRRETWFAGWSAEIGGRPTAIHGADGLFQVVTVRTGSHHITFRFVPAGMNRALLGLPAWVALMLALTASSASSFRVRR